MKVENGLQMSWWWFLSLFQLSASYWLQKRIYKGSFINGGLSQGPVAVLLGLSVVDKLKRNYSLFSARQLIYDNGKECGRQTFSQSGLTRWQHVLPSKSPFKSRWFYAAMCCFHLSANRTKHWPISLYSLAAEEREMLCSKWRPLHNDKIYFAISFSSLALSVQLLTSRCHLHHSVTLFFHFNTVAGNCPTEWPIFDSNTW